MDPEYDVPRGLRILPVSKLGDAGDIQMFWCPGCDDAHGVNVAPGGWTYNGDPESPTFAPSVRVLPSANVPPCHSFVTAGRIEFLTDSAHALAGQIVDLPDWPYE